MLGGICPSPVMSCMYCTFDVLLIYIRLLFRIACLAYHTPINVALYQPQYPELLIVLTSNELQPHSSSLLAHSMANINLIKSTLLRPKLGGRPKAILQNAGTMHVAFMRKIARIMSTFGRTMKTRIQTPTVWKLSITRIYKIR